MYTSLKTTIILLAVMFVTQMTGQDALPIAITGNSYGRHEVKILINNAIVVDQSETYVYKSFEGELPLDELNQYGTLIIAHSLKTPLDDSAMKKLKNWVASGGTLILMNHAPNGICGGPAKLIKDQMLAWAGIKSIASRGSDDCKVLVQDHEIMKGIETGWLGKVVPLAVVEPPMQSVIGNGQLCLFGVANVGKGRVFYLGPELFRMRTKKLPLADSYLALIRNVIRTAKPLNQSHKQENVD